MGQRTVKLNPHDFVKDVRDGLDDSRLIDKYGLTKAALEQLLQKAMDKSLLTREELEARKAWLNRNSSQGGPSDNGQESSFSQTDGHEIQEDSEVKEVGLSHKRSLFGTFLKWNELSIWQKILLFPFYFVTYEISGICRVLSSPVAFIMFLVAPILRSENVSVREAMKRTVKWIAGP